MRSRRLPIRGMFAVEMGKQSVNFIGQGYLFVILVGYLLRGAIKNLLKQMPLCVIVLCKNRVSKRASFLHIVP